MTELAVVEGGKINIDELLSNRPGGILRPRLFEQTKQDMKAALELASFAQDLSKLPGHKRSARGLLRDAMKLLEPA